MSRALMHQLTRLLPSASEEQKKVSKLCKRMQAISKANPSKAGPKSMLVQAMMNVARAKKDFI